MDGGCWVVGKIISKSYFTKKIMFSLGGGA